MWLETHCAALPDLLILDLGPGTDSSGELIERLALDARVKHLPILLFANGAQLPAADSTNLRYRGAKPCCPGQLADIIAHSLSAPAPEASAKIFELHQPLDILVAEDNLVNTAVLQSMLQKHEHGATFCENGEAARRFAKRPSNLW